MTIHGTHYHLEPGDQVTWHDRSPHWGLGLVTKVSGYFFITVRWADGSELEHAITSLAPATQPTHGRTIE